MSKLTAVKIKALLKSGDPGFYGDGLKLYLHVQKFGRASWIFRYMRRRRRRDMGLGALDVDGIEGVSLQQARDKAAACRQQLRDGLDPILERDRLTAERHAAEDAVAGRPFKEVAEEYWETHKSTWSNEKHAEQWIQSLRNHVFPTKGKVPVARFSSADMVEVLKPIWTTIPETAARVRGRCETVFGFAKAKGWREGDNPAGWTDNLSHMLPAQPVSKRVKHHPAMPWKEVPDFMVELDTRHGAAANALELLILTAKRTEETIGATCGEFDREAKLWRIPGERMKSRRDHTVTLSAPAIALLDRIWPEDSEADTPLFPSPVNAGRPISSAAMDRLLQDKMKHDDVTVHGFRTSFRTFIQEATDFPDDVAEAALAHMKGDKTEAAYARGEMLKKRARMMEHWGRYCMSKRH